MRPSRDHPVMEVLQGSRVEACRMLSCRDEGETGASVSTWEHLRSIPDGSNPQRRIRRMDRKDPTRRIRCFLFRNSIPVLVAAWLSAKIPVGKIPDQRICRLVQVIDRNGVLALDVMVHWVLHPAAPRRNIPENPNTMEF